MSHTTKPRSEATAAILNGSAPLPELLHDRFRLQTELKHTGSARLFRAWDERLKSFAAVKLIAGLHAPEVAELDSTPVEERFKHPYLVRLLDRGPHDGGVWLAMEWVEGGTLLDLIRGHHRTDEHDLITRPTGEDRAAPTTTGSPATLRQLLHLLAEASAGIGAAHRQGWVHLDLKPNNIMYEARDTPDEPGLRPMAWRAWIEEEGAFDREAGELVLRQLTPRLIDWELARPVRAVPAGDGPVLGVPSYLAPEYVRRQPVEATADVYALGAVLYHILVGERPYGGVDRDEVLARLTRGEPPPRAVSAAPDLAPFVEVCQRAMHLDPAQRYPDGVAFGLALRRAQAQCILLQADVLRVRTETLRQESQKLTAQAAGELAELGFCHPGRKAHAWALQEQATQLEDEAHQREAQWAQQVRAVLAVDPGLPTGRASLIGWLTDRYRRAARESRPRDAKLLLAELETERKLFADLRLDPVPPPLRPVVGAADDVLSRRAYLSLRTRPDAVIEIARVTMQRRRLEVGDYRRYGVGALEHVPLGAGRVVVRITAPDCSPVIYPIELILGEHAHLTPPGATVARALPLPPATGMARDDVYIAPGWCWLGGQPFAPDAPSGRRVWIDGFVIKANPVTHREWLAYMHALAAEGRGDEAWERRPRVPLRSSAVPTYRRHAEDGGAGFTMRADRVAPDVALDWPVSGISWHDARAYARWRAAVDGVPWRLPSEWEFEKAARCNDGRRLPWGEHLEPRWTRVAGSTLESYCVAPVSDQTGDVTVHGVRWTVGNVLTWCLDAFDFAGPHSDRVLDVGRLVGTSDPGGRMLRGAAYLHAPDIVSCSTRFASPPDHRTSALGLRLVRSWP